MEVRLGYILCPSCKFKTLSEYALCKHCGNPLPSRASTLALLSIIIKSGSRPGAGRAAALIQSNPSSPFVLTQGVTSIGRMDDNTIILTDGQVSRHHAVISRDQTGAYRVEDLQSKNGTFLNSARLEAPALVKAGDCLRIGETELRFAEAPRPEFIQSGTPLHPEATIIGLADPSRTVVGSLESMKNTVWAGRVLSESYRPQAREGWALRHLKEEGGRDYYVLKGLGHSGYLRLAERDVFLWKLMDGRHTLRDMLVAYMRAYRALGADRLADLLEELYEKGFLQNTRPAYPAQPGGKIANLLSVTRRVVGVFFQKQFPIQGADEWITRLYTRFAWRFYTRSGQLALAVIALAGFAAFGFILLQGGHSLLAVGGSTVLGLVVLALAGTLSIFLHEMGHALTVKAYNRQVRRVGFMIYFGMPVFFVDTSDIWMEPQRPRLQASLAGPYASFLFGSIASLAMLASPASLIGDLLLKLAAWSYLDAFFNLNPLLELDGYFLLMDWLEMPLLRKHSLEFVRHHLWEKLWNRQPFSREEKLFGVFGILSVLWSAIAVGIFLFYEGPRLFGIFRGDPAGLVFMIPVVLMLALLGLLALRFRRSGQKDNG